MLRTLTIVKMEEIDNFLEEFGSEIFHQHLELILAFRRKYNNAEIITADTNCCQYCSQSGDITDTCSCFHFKKEKERVMKLIYRYYELLNVFANGGGSAV